MDTPPDQALVIRHDADDRRFSTVVEGSTGYIEYERVDQVLVLTHTIVPRQIGGRGIAADAVDALLGGLRGLVDLLHRGLGRLVDLLLRSTRGAPGRCPGVTRLRRRVLAHLFGAVADLSDELADARLRRIRWRTHDDLHRASGPIGEGRARRSEQQHRRDSPSFLLPLADVRGEIALDRAPHLLAIIAQPVECLLDLCREQSLRQRTTATGCPAVGGFNSCAAIRMKCATRAQMARTCSA